LPTTKPYEPQMKRCLTLQYRPSLATILSLPSRLSRRLTKLSTPRLGLASRARRARRSEGMIWHGRCER
jgi:hypothetical protein